MWANPPHVTCIAIQRYLALEPAPINKRRRYYGSPIIELAFLRSVDRLLLSELDQDTSAKLQANVAHDTRALVKQGDGIAALPTKLQECDDDAAVLVVIDPSYASKEEWLTIPQTLIDIYRLRPQTHILLWYPVKSYTRPNAMLQKLGASGVPSIALELITTPLELQKNRLNGNGVLLINAPEIVICEVMAAAPVLGRIEATHADRFTCRTLGWTNIWNK